MRHYLWPFPLRFVWWGSSQGMLGALFKNANAADGCFKARPADPGGLVQSSTHREQVRVTHGRLNQSSKLGGSVPSGAEPAIQAKQSNFLMGRHTPAKLRLDPEPLAQPEVQPTHQRLPRSCSACCQRCSVPTSDQYPRCRLASMLGGFSWRRISSVMDQKPSASVAIKPGW